MPSEQFKRLVAIRTGGGTERCHGIRHQGSYSVSQHTWGVLALLYVLWPEDFLRLAAVAMFHDVPEAWVGDIPAPTKKYSRAVKEACDKMEIKIFRRLKLPHDLGLSDADKTKLKACDRLDLYAWANEQVTSGNEHASCILRELDTFFQTEILPAPADEMYLEMKHTQMRHDTDGLIKEIA